MKNLLKNICICLLVASCTTLPSSKKNQSFIILKTKDSIFGNKIRFSRRMNKLGQVKVVNAAREKRIVQYDEIYQVYHYRKGQEFYVEEMVMLTPNNPISYTPMDVIITKGALKLYEHDPTNWGNTSFVVSDVYHGYIRTKNEYYTLLSALNKCTDFREKFPEKPEFTQSNLEKVIHYYNENCE